MNDPELAQDHDPMTKNANGEYSIQQMKRRMVREEKEARAEAAQLRPTTANDANIKDSSRNNNYIKRQRRQAHDLLHDVVVMMEAGILRSNTRRNRQGSSLKFTRRADQEMAHELATIVEAQMPSSTSDPS
jgi:hypothetical protein